MFVCKQNNSKISAWIFTKSTLLFFVTEKYHVSVNVRLMYSRNQTSMCEWLYERIIASLNRQAVENGDILNGHRAPALLCGREKWSSNSELQELAFCFFYYVLLAPISHFPAHLLSKRNA